MAFREKRSVSSSLYCLVSVPLTIASWKSRRLLFVIPKQLMLYPEPCSATATFYISYVHCRRYKPLKCLAKSTSVLLLWDMYWDTILYSYVEDITNISRERFQHFLFQNILMQTLPLNSVNLHYMDVSCCPCMWFRCLPLPFVPLTGVSSIVLSMVSR